MVFLLKNKLFMKSSYNNYAFIDAQNLYQATVREGWAMDYKKFRIYLLEKEHVSKAYMFIGYKKENQKLYDYLQKSGFDLVFKKTVNLRNGLTKGNVDVDLTMKVLLEKDIYNKAVIVTSDGDFYPLISYLKDHEKLKKIIIPDKKRYSFLLKPFVCGHVTFLTDLEKIRKHSKKTVAEKDTVWTNP